MDGQRFDNLTKRLASGTSRRAVLKGLAAGLLGGLTGLAGAEATAQRAARQANGAACATATDCASSFCANGICCATACARQCESCASGACQLVTGAPEAGRTPCPGDGPCQATCDGVTTDSCAAWPGAETACGEATCTDGWQTTYACAGNGSCAPTTTSCAPFGCSAEGADCASGCTSDADCTPGNSCAEDGQCRPVEGLGAPCEADGDCHTGFCIDDVCCVERCGACQVCNLPGNEGFCGPGPDGTACDGGTCCEGGCVDTLTDVEHCGACDNACLGIANGRAICADGVCTTECLPGFKECNGACIADDACCTAADCVPTPGTCEGAATCEAGTCVFAPTVGGTCLEAPDGCHDDAVCDGQSTTCPQNPELCAAEQCCAGQCCPEDQQCDGDTCVPICVARGEACTTTEECCQDTPTVCDDNTCQLCGDAGQPCCAGSSCEGDVACCNEVCCAEGEVCTAGRCATRQQVTFAEPGTHRWQVSPGVECAGFEVFGAQGGDNNISSWDGGPGGRLQATLRLTPGDELAVTVGAAGGQAVSHAEPGSGGGGAGAGGNGGGNGGGGGGASEVRHGAVRLLVAGGGGGASHQDPGGAGGGLSGASGEGRNGGDPGTGGTQTGPGAGGAPGGQDGVGPDGGNGGAGDEGGGGGGGGYFGGGGGAGGPVGTTETGGGGGSGFISPDTSIVVAGEFLEGGNDGNGLVRITYPVVCPPAG